MSSVALVWIAPIAGLLGVVTGGAVTSWTASRRERAQRSYAYRERQLRELYSPLLGVRSEIRLRSEVRTRISSVADEEWKRLCERIRHSADPIESHKKLDFERWPAFARVIDYSNQELREDLIPSYQKMVGIFRDNMWLAEPETRAYFDTLVEFVAIWEQWLARAIPHEVITGLGHSEATLLPLYEHIEKHHDELRRRLAGGDA